MTDQMDTVIVPSGPCTGQVTIPASKSRAHRLLICAALSEAESEIICHGISRDIQATADCLRGMGVDLTQQEHRFLIHRPLSLSAQSDREAVLPCGESGSTLRFLLPVVGALGIPAVFRMEGRLPERPMDPLTKVLSEHGMQFLRCGNELHCSGTLSPGQFAIPGNISSQFVSGLLFALPLLAGSSVLQVSGEVESAAYISMTEDALRLAGFTLKKEGTNYRIPGNQRGSMPAVLEVERDWSSAAFFCCLGAFSAAGVTVCGMNPDSVQGDRAILKLLADFGAAVHIEGNAVTVRRGNLRGLIVDASGIPDLVPVISVVAAAACGRTVIRHAERLRMKESDRLKTTAAMLSALGADIRETVDGLIIEGAGDASFSLPCLLGGQVSSFMDHRIAMSAAVAASACRQPVIVTGARCTDKSFPGFWETLLSLQKEASRS